MSSRILTAGFTPPNTNEPAWENVGMHLTMDGSSGATTVTDNRTGIVYSITNGNLNTSTKKFGTASMNLLPVWSGQGFIGTSNTALSNILGYFTLRGWFYFPSSDTTPPIMRIVTAGGGNASWNQTDGIHWIFQKRDTGALNFQVLNNTSMVEYLTPAGLVTNNQWHYITLTSYQSKVFIGIGGKVYYYDFGFVPTKPSGSPTLRIGGLIGESFSNGLRGFIDDFQLIPGEILFTSDYDVPTEPHSIGAPVGQQVFSTSTVSSNTSPIVDTFVVPTGVNEISALVMGSGRSNYIPGSIKLYRLESGGYKNVIISDTSTIGINFGGGNGGNPGSVSSGGLTGGGGGAAGYFGNGGDGGNGDDTNTGLNKGTDGNGGGSGGGYGGYFYSSNGIKGGSTGLNGVGANGSGGLGQGYPATNGSQGDGSVIYAGGGESLTTETSKPLFGVNCGKGGNLRYNKNPIPVTPGESLKVDLFIGGAIRIIWGSARNYPFNAKNTVI